MMGKKQNLSYLTDEERDKIMLVLQKDFELRRTEKKLINEAHDELVKEKNRIAVLKEKDKFTENSCIICLERFGVLFHRKRKCHKCDLNVCSECSQARDKKKGFICKVCSKEKAYKMLSNEWFYHSSHATDKNSGSSRIVKWLHKRPVADPSDTDVDSGYNQSSCSSAGPAKARARLDNVFDINIKERVDEELPQPSSEATPLSSSDPLEALSPDRPGSSQPGQHSQTVTSDQPVEETVVEASHQKPVSAETPVPKIVPRLSPQNDLKSQSASAAAPTPRSRTIKGHNLRALDTEAIDRIKKAEESNFRVEFDKLLRDLYETLDDEDLDVFTTNTESPSYEDMMHTFKDNVTDILKGFTERLQMAYEKCGSTDLQANHRETVQQELCQFIGGFIGENVNTTSDAATSDVLSALKDSSTVDGSFEDLLAQCLVGKLFDNHYNEVREALWSSSKSSITNLNRNSSDESDDACAQSSPSDDGIKDSLSGADKDGIKDNLSGDEEDDIGQESNINAEIQELKEFVKNTSRRPKIEVSAVDDSNLCEVNEDTFVKTAVDRDEDRGEFCARYSILDRIHNSSLTLPDISCFESGATGADDETDPDLLSLNLAIIPEETEEETELDIEKKANWSFKGKTLSPTKNLASTNEQVSPRGSLRMRVPIPENIHIPRIGHRNIDQLSDFSDLDVSEDDEENTFYANTSTELARIATQRGKLNSSYQLSDYQSEDSDLSGRLKQHNLSQKLTTDLSASSCPTSEVDVESLRPDIKLLHNLIPADDDDPAFLVAPRSVVAQEGEPVQFSCRVGGTGHIDVFWYREGNQVEELEDSSDVDISSEGDKHSIVLYNVSRKLAGQYMCIAVNEKGKTTQYLALTVKDNKLEFKKPEFLKGLKDVEVTEGQSVKFRVKVKGYPQPRVTWYKDGKLLKSSRLCRIEKFGNRDYILAIDRASMNDDAEYTVVARNVAGEENLSAQIIVEPQSDLPVRKQNTYSTTTSGVSDSDSDRPFSYQTLIFNRNSKNVTSLTSDGNVAQTLASPSPRMFAVRQQDNQFTTNTEDQQEAFSQKEGEPSYSRRLLTDDVLSDLKVAEDIIRQEQTSSQAVKNQRNKRLDSEISASSAKTDNGSRLTTFQSDQKQDRDSQLEAFYLPDSLDDCEPPASSGQDQCNSDAPLPDMQKHKQQVLNVKCSRDFEIPLTAKKKTQPSSYGPQLSSRNTSIDRRNDMSTDSDVPNNSIEDNALPSKNVRHPCPVETSDNPPDNGKDQSVLLPSVDKLKEVFSTEQDDDDDIEGGKLKRVHSITARNVPKEHLESLRASHHNLSSSSSSGKFLNVPEPSPMASDHIAPESQPTHNTTLSASSDMRKSSSSANPTSSDMRTSSSSANPTSLKKRNSFQLPTKEAFTTLDGQKEPVLIYLNRNPKDMQQHRPHNQPSKEGMKSKSQTEHLLSESNQQKPANQRLLTATKQKASNQLQHSTIVTQTARQNRRSEHVDTSGPRIQGGCISARAAFWERKIAHGEAGNQEEFPDMVESNDTQF